MIPQETVSLVLTQGTVLDDGARIPPNSPFELTGGLVFETTEETPISIAVLIANVCWTNVSAQTYDEFGTLNSVASGIRDHTVDMVRWLFTIKRRCYG